MIRSSRDLDDLDDSLFDREEAARRKLEREAMIASGQERLRQEAARDAIVKAEAVEFTKETTRRAILAEYAAAGVEPRPGTLVSLGMLRKLGWRIEHLGLGVHRLVAPPTQPTYVPRKREQS